MDQPVLTKNQLKRALSGKKTKKCIRNTLVNPYEITWPIVKEEDEKALLHLIKELTMKMKRPKLKIELNSIKSVAKNERRTFRRQQREQLLHEMGLENSAELRANLVMGVNHLARSIEKGEVVSAVIARDVDPAMLTKFLVPLASTRQLPLISIAGLAKATEDSLGFRCVALGFKSEVEQQDNHFHQLHMKIKDLAASLPNPSWMGRPASTATTSTAATTAAPPISTPESGTSASSFLLTKEEPQKPTLEVKPDPLSGGASTAASSTATTEGGDGGEGTSADPYLYRTSSKYRAFVPPRKAQPSKSADLLPYSSAVGPSGSSSAGGGGVDSDEENAVEKMKMPRPLRFKPPQHHPWEVKPQLPPPYSRQGSTLQKVLFAVDKVPAALSAPPPLPETVLAGGGLASSATASTASPAAAKKRTGGRKGKKRKRVAEVAFKPMKIKKVQSNPNKRIS